jgi:hypothetical protein
MNLHDLPLFTIERILNQATAPHLAGAFSHVSGVREGRSWLYHPTHALIGDLEQLSLSTREAVFAAPFWTPDGPAQVGEALPWVDGYWQANDLTMILDPTIVWKRTTFAPVDAQYFDLGGVRGWQEVGKPLPEGATPLYVAPGGWDHEHCNICDAKIGESWAPIGYVTSTAYWLCEPCYARYAVPHDVSFVAAT